MQGPERSSKLAPKKQGRKGRVGGIDQQTAVEELRALAGDGRAMRLAAEEWQEPWQVLISVLLSARTRDETTIKVSTELFQRYPGLEELAEARREEVEACIRPVNYYRTKARRILACARMLVSEFQATCPLAVEQLTRLPGVGRKTANVFLGEMGKDAIGVDTHVAYVARTLEWTRSANPDKIEEDLRKLFPRSLWRNLNPILVRFGKTHTRSEKETVLRSLRERRQRYPSPIEEKRPQYKDS